MNRLMYWITICFAVFSFQLGARPFMTQSSPIVFGEIVPITGTCEMDFNTEIVSDLTGGNMCMKNQQGGVGKYRIWGFKNRDYSILLRRKQPQNGDGFAYFPVGEIQSNGVSTVIVEGQTHIINSGENAFIDIVLAGQIMITVPYMGGGSYSIESEDIIEWAQLP